MTEPFKQSQIMRTNEYMYWYLMGQDEIAKWWNSQIVMARLVQLSHKKVFLSTFIRQNLLSTEKTTECRQPRLSISLIALYAHPPHRYPAKFVSVLLYSPYLFGKKLFSMQDNLKNNTQKPFLKHKFWDNNSNRQKLYVVV